MQFVLQLNHPRTGEKGEKKKMLCAFFVQKPPKNGGEEKRKEKKICARCVLCGWFVFLCLCPFVFGFVR
jgi:hypothetical protein